MTAVRTREEIFSSLKWSAPREVATKRGPRIVTSAPANNEVFDLYNREREQLYKLGYSLSEFKGQSQITRWSEVDAKVIASREEAKVLSRATDADINVPVPEGLTLLGYQKAGIKFCYDRDAALIGDEMGLGKSIQAIGIANALPDLEWSLVLCPASLKLNWEKEIRRWDIHGGMVIILDGTKGLTKSQRNGLQCLRALDSEIRQKSSEASKDVGFGVKVPSKLGLSSEASRGTSISEASVRGDPSHQCGVGVVDHNLPRDVSSARGHQASFAVQDASKVGSVSSAPRSNERARDSLFVDADSKAIAQPSEFANRDAKRSTDRCIAGTSSDLVYGSSNLGNVELRSPMSISTTLDASRLKREIKSLEVDLQGVVATCEFTSRFTQCDLAILNALRKWLQKQFTECSWFHDGRKWIIINYDIVHAWRSSLGAIGQLDYLIADEAHYLKTPTSLRTVSVFGRDAKKATPKKPAEPAIAPVRAKKRILLTGTPIANRPVELWPLIHYLDPVRWSNFFKFGIRYCEGHNNGFGWDFTGASNLQELQDILRSSILIRRLKKDVLTELPAKRRQVIEFPAEGKLARFVENENDAYFEHEEEIEHLHAAVELAKASDNPEDYKLAVANLKKGITAIFAGLSTQRRELAEAKTDLCIDHIKNAVEESGKVIVFGHHQTVVEAIAAAFGSEAVHMHGGTKIEDRQAAIDRFQKDPTCKVISGSIGAMGVGYTLTAAAHVIFCELSWVPGEVSQGEDRCHRIGQRESVLVQHLVIEGSLDATMAKRIVSKQNVIDQALDTVTIASGLSVESPFRKKLGESATTGTTVDQLAKEALEMTSDQRAAVREALQFLSGRDIDHAQFENGIGFSGIDTVIGNDLANRGYLSPKQCALGRKIVWRYKNTQLPASIVERLGLPAKKEAA